MPKYASENAAATTRRVLRVQCQRNAYRGQVGMARKVRWRLRGKEQSTLGSYYVFILARSLLYNLSISLFSNFQTYSFGNMCIMYRSIVLKPCLPLVDSSEEVYRVEAERKLLL